MVKSKSAKVEELRRYTDLLRKQTGMVVRPYRADGYVNLLNKYGTSKDMSEGYEFEKEPPVPDETLTSFYEGNGLFARIIDAPAEEAIKHGFSLKGVSDAEIEEFYTEALDELDWEETCMNAIKWARLFGGSIAVMLINDGRSLDEPLDWRNIQSIDDIRVYDRSVIVPDYSSMFHYTDDNPFSSRGSRLGMPEYYSVYSKYGNFRVHDSRCLVFQNGVLPENSSNSVYQIWGMPEYIRLKRAIRDSEIAHGTASKLLDRSVQAIYKMKDLAAEMATEEGEDRVLRRLQIIDMAKGLLNSIAIDSEGEEYEYRQFSFSGVSEVINTTCDYLSALTSIPQTILFGRSPAGMNATGHSDMENWYSYVERIQKRMVKKNLRYLLSIIFQAGLHTGEIDEIPKIEVEFKPLWSMSESEQVALEQQKVSLQQTRAATAQMYVDMQVLDPSEVRKKLADSNEFDIETMLDEYTEEELFENAPKQEEEAPPEGGAPGGMPGMPGMPEMPEMPGMPPQGGGEPDGQQPPIEGAVPEAKPEGAKPEAPQPEMAKQEVPKPAPEEQKAEAQKPEEQKPAQEEPKPEVKQAPEAKPAEAKVEAKEVPEKKEQGLSKEPKPKLAEKVSGEEHDTDTGGNAPAAAPAATKLPQDMSDEEKAKAEEAQKKLKEEEKPVAEEGEKKSEEPETEVTDEDNTAEADIDRDALMHIKLRLIKRSLENRIKERGENAETEGEPEDRPSEVTAAPRNEDSGNNGYFYTDQKGYGAVGIYVVKDGMILSGTRKSGDGTGMLCGPGGHIEGGETPAQAAIRETQEEFGITPMELIPIGRGEKGISGLQPYLFLCLLYEGEPKCDDDEMTMPVFRRIEDYENDSEHLFPAFKDGLNKLKGKVKASVDKYFTDKKVDISGKYGIIESGSTNLDGDIPESELAFATTKEGRKFAYSTKTGETSGLGPEIDAENDPDKATKPKQIKASPKGKNKRPVGFEHRGTAKYKLSKHGIAYPGMSLDDFVKKACDLLEMPCKGNIDGYMNKDGSIVRFDKTTGDFAVGFPGGYLKTMYNIGYNSNGNFSIQRALNNFKKYRERDAVKEE